MRVVLPTMEIVYDRKNYLEMFDDSNEDGIRGIIRQAVECYGCTEKEIEKLVSKLVSQFENSFTAIYHATVENYTFSVLVEIGIRNLIDEVHSVIYNLYRTKAITFNARQCVWVGNDIVVSQEPVCIINQKTP